MTTPSTKVSRLSEKQSASRDQLDELLDGTPLATVALVRDGHPVIFPTGFARVADEFVIHGSTGSPWMRALAAHPNVAVKVSGLSLPGMPWTAQTQGAVILETIDMFGIDRCMFASNFPPDNCVTEYAPMMDAFTTVMACCSDDERDRFFYANAKRYYRPVP